MNLNSTSGSTYQDHSGFPRQSIEQALDWLRKADGLVVAAGAGMGVDSGLPDFRGNEGLWRAYPALGEARLDFTSIASPDAFRRNPKLTWGFYGHRLALYRNTRPHAGFDILRRWGEQMSQGSFVYTSNVDGQFQTAGFSPERVVECHGTIHHFQCMAPCRMQTWPTEGWEPQVDEQACELRSALPSCPHCGGLARPNVLMFGDYEWVPDHTEAQLQRLEAWLQRVTRPVVIEVGAGTAVPSVRWFAASVGAPIVRINLRESHIAPGQGVGLAGKALEALRMLDERLQSEQR